MRPLLQRAAAAAQEGAAQEGGSRADRQDDLGAEDVEVEVTQDTAGPFLFVAAAVAFSLLILLLLLLVLLFSYSLILLLLSLLSFLNFAVSRYCYT